MQIEELIDKLSAATEGSMSLDNEISRLIGREWEVIRVGNMSEALGGPKQPVREERRDNFYTTSLDAALRLVPSDWYWEVALGVRVKHRGSTIDDEEMKTVGPYWATLYPMDQKLLEPLRLKEVLDFEYDLLVGGNSAPLALCIAALRARQAKP